MRLLALLALLVVASACAPGFEGTEVLRVPGPDGALDAVVVEGSAGATTPFVHVVTLTGSGCEAPDDAPAEAPLRVVGPQQPGSASGMSVVWEGPRAVRVSWLDASARFPDADSVVVDTEVGPVTVLSGGGVAAPPPPGGIPAGGGPTRDC